jgi:hypothetical protein
VDEGGANMATYSLYEMVINEQIVDQEARHKSFSLASQAILTLNTQF